MSTKTTPGNPLLEKSFTKKPDLPKLAKVREQLLQQQASMRKAPEPPKKNG